MNNPAIRIEQYLRLYEDNMFRSEIYDKCDEATGNGKKVFAMPKSVRFWREVRNSLLHLSPGMSWSEVEKHLAKHLTGHPSRDIELLGMWIANSRRMYCVSRDLQALLSATSIDGITWDQVQLPFESFAVTLAQPLLLFNLEYDTVVVARNQAMKDTDEPYFFLFILPSVLSEMRFLSPQERREISKFVERRKWKTALNKIDARCRRSVWIGNNAIYSQVASDFRLMSKTTADAPNLDNVCRQALRVIAGMCLYFKTLPAKSSHLSSWQRPGMSMSTDRIDCICEESEVCFVETEFKLSSEERTVMELHSRDLSNAISPHFRQGYWHRPYGLGQDPSAKRTEWTRPTVVNRHLLKEGQLPKGACTILLK